MLQLGIYGISVLRVQPGLDLIGFMYLFMAKSWVLMIGISMFKLERCQSY